jgi:hypothetical protein
MTVEQYSTRFMELARFAANLIPDKESKAERFENGLIPRIKERVICLEIKDFTRLVDLKKRSKQQMSYPAKRSAKGNGSRLSVGKSLPPAVRNQGPPYNKCGKTHTGDCREGRKNCF